MLGCAEHQFVWSDIISDVQNITLSVLAVIGYAEHQFCSSTKTYEATVFCQITLTEVIQMARTCCASGVQGLELLLLP